MIPLFMPDIQRQTSLLLVSFFTLYLRTSVALLPIPMAFQIGTSKCHLSCFHCCCSAFMSVSPFRLCESFSPYPPTMPPLPYPQDWQSGLSSALISNSLHTSCSACWIRLSSSTGFWLCFPSSSSTPVDMSTSRS